MRLSKIGLIVQQRIEPFCLNDYKTSKNENPQNRFNQFRDQLYRRASRIYRKKIADSIYGFSFQQKIV